MRRFKSELYEAIYEDFLDDFESGIITEAEFREFEADAFIEEDSHEVSAQRKEIAVHINTR
jgi:hypothetical protein